MSKIVIGALCLTLALVCFAVFVWQDIRRGSQLALLELAGKTAAKNIQNTPEAKGSVAAEFINIPIHARPLSSNLYQVTGIGNVQAIVTKTSIVLFDTGLAPQVPKQMKALKKVLPDLPISHIILSHSHADHTGGTHLWSQKGKTKIVAHKEFLEEQRYLTELQDYFWSRNRTLFPFMPESPPNFGPLAYGGIEPDIEVRNGEPFFIEDGGVRMEVYALPGAEGADNVVLWLPEARILLSGDFFGPLFPQFPNIFTMRGEKVRKPVEYMQSLKTIIDLDPVMIVPSHKNPIIDQNEIRIGLQKIHDAVDFVHKAVVKGMNDGRSMHELMQLVKLPADLALTQEHGKVSWAVKSIWEYYATWFHFDDTTELYHVPHSAIYPDLMDLVDPEKLEIKIEYYIDNDRPLEALHLLKVTSGRDEPSPKILKLKKRALKQLLNQAKATDNNAYEIYWLNAQINKIQSELSPE